MSSSAPIPAAAVAVADPAVPNSADTPPLIAVTGETLALVTALSDPSVNHSWHVAALQALDQALQASVASYTNVCEQLAALLHLASTVGSSGSINGASGAAAAVAPENSPATVTWSTFMAQQLVEWKVTHEPLVLRLEHDKSLWIPLGQTAGLMLKNALTRPPNWISSVGVTLATMRIPSDSSSSRHIQSLLVATLSSTLGELRAVASSIIAAVAVSKSVASQQHLVQVQQPALHIAVGWPNLVATLHAVIQSSLTRPVTTTTSSAAAVAVARVEGSLLTLCKIMEDGPTMLTQSDLDQTVALLIGLLTLFVQQQQQQRGANTARSTVLTESMIVMALQSLVHCWAAPVWPHVMWDEYWQALSGLVSTSSTTTATTSTTPAAVSTFSQQQWLIRHWVCRSMVTLLDSRTSEVAPHLSHLLPFLLDASVPLPPLSQLSTQGQYGNSNSDDDRHTLVALEACDFWLTFASLDDTVLSGDMHDAVGAVLPQLVPILLSNMVYSPSRQAELLQLNHEAVIVAAVQQQSQSAAPATLRPIFHKSRNAPTTQQSMSSTKTQPDQDNNDADDDDIDDDDDDDDDDDNEEDEEGWTLRKCSAASLDALANLYGGDIILPCLLPSLELGLQQGNDPWKQEACILALGAIAEGCWEEMNPHMAQIHPYLMHLLSASSAAAAPDGATHEILPQVKCMAAWTLGQYAAWAVEQVQSGQQGHLLAQMTQELLRNMVHANPKIQVACGAALGVVIGAAGDLMAPYLEPVFTALAATLSQFHGYSLLTVLDVWGTIGECCGPGIAEGHLPTLYVPELMRLWDRLAQRDVRDRTLLTLMESTASIALMSAMNFQPYALEAFEKSMSMIEATTLLLATAHGDGVTNEEDVDPIVAAIDLMDSLVEGLGANFGTLVQSSARYGPQVLNVVLDGCKHEIPGVRMSALALVGDLARNAPALLEPAVSLLLPEAIHNMDPVQPSVAINAVWSVGEICLRCQGHPALLEPHAPALLQSAIGLLMGNGDHDGSRSRGSAILGLPENAAACVGRLALVQPHFVANEVSRFLCGWCDGMGKIRDERERHDAFSGLVAVIYANPQAILQPPPGANTNNDGTTYVLDAIASILFAILTWHVPAELPEDAARLLSEDEYNLVPFPSTEAELGATLVKLVQDVNASVGPDVWQSVMPRLPSNLQILLRDTYNV